MMRLLIQILFFVFGIAGYRAWGSETVHDTINAPTDNEDSQMNEFFSGDASRWEYNSVSEPRFAQKFGNIQPDHYHTIRPVSFEDGENVFRQFLGNSISGNRKHWLEHPQQMDALNLHQVRQFRGLVTPSTSQKSRKQGIFSSTRKTRLQPFSAEQYYGSDPSSYYIVEKRRFNRAFGEGIWDI